MEATQSTIEQDTTALVDSVSDCTQSTSKSGPKGQPGKTLLLCQVCGASASGLHFGVFTCEGCKCFYRRTIKEGVSYICTKSKECSITIETRNTCRYCRFQKCISLGMCKEGIKLGRRPKVDVDIDLRTNDIKDLPRWHSWPTVSFPSNGCQQVIKQEPIFHGDMPDCSGYSSQYYTKHQQYYSKQKSFDNLDRIFEPTFNMEFTPDIYQVSHAMQPAFATNYQNSSLVANLSHMSNSSNISNLSYMPNSANLSNSSHISNSSLMPNLSHLSNSSHVSLSNTYSQSGSQPPLSPSLSMTLPEVHTGAFTAMAYANMYRGQYVDGACDDFRSVEIKTESNDFDLTELTAVKKNRETDIVSSTSYETCDQYKQIQPNLTNDRILNEISSEESLKRKISISNDNNNNSKIPKISLANSDDFVTVYEHLEKLVVEQWTSSLKFSDNISELINPNKSSMSKVKSCFRKFSEMITGFKDLKKECREQFLQEAMCPVLGLIITHHFMNKSGEKDCLVLQHSEYCEEDIQRLSNLEMAVLCGICLTQKGNIHIKEDNNKLYLMKTMELFLQTSLEGLFQVDRYSMLLNLANKICETSNGDLSSYEGSALGCM